MTPRESGNTDARQSTFNDVGRDQIVTTTNNIIMPNSTVHHLISNYTEDQPIMSFVAAPLSHSGLPTPVCYSEAGDKAACLIIDTMQLLMVRAPSDNHHHLKQELESMQQTLTLTRLAIQAYEHSPLGRSLTNAINEEVEGCRVILQELLDKIRQLHNSTRFSYFWRGVAVDELGPLRVMLSGRQESLGQCLMALDS